jgi:3-methylfumaryl-CoA hydratase
MGTPAAVARPGPKISTGVLGVASIDAAELRRHIGKRMADEDVATQAPLKAIVATFDLPEEAPRPGEVIPPGWHIGYFLPMARASSLAADGLPTGTGVLPPLPLPRRMYAGTRITFHAPLQVGDAIRRETELTDLAVREGSTGTLILTTQTRRIWSPRGLAMTEAYDTVFREAVEPGAKSGTPKRDPVPTDLPWRQTIAPDPVSLFRFSALTFNPHRIHYDRPYAMQAEGYPGLVVHGPFTQLCLTNFVRRCNPGRSLRTFAMRARAPLFDDAPFSLVGRPTDGGRACEAWAVTPGGTVAMQATATFD